MSFQTSSKPEPGFQNGLNSRPRSGRKPRRVSIASQFLTMKIREKNMRDRWLLNIRKADYSIYLTSAFLLLSAKSTYKYSRKVVMDENVQEEIKALIALVE